MSDNWKSYLCRVNNCVASIRFDLGICAEVPLASKPWLLWIWVYFQTPRPDGLSDGKEAPVLFQIEDALTAELSRRCNAVLCGVITTEGRREFYLYGDASKGLRAAVSNLLAQFPTYKFDFGEKEDASWNQYLDVLYPSERDLQKIANMDLIEQLQQRGDVLSVKREVHHWIYFRSAQSRDLFGKALDNSEYKIVSKSDGAPGERPFSIVVSRVQSVQQNTVDEIVLGLIGIAQQFDGDYDGWETPLVTQ